MKTLGNITPLPKSVHSRKRLGRGVGSGLGKTAGKGHKGQWARRGRGVIPGFEGGQMKLYMRLPKRGFKSLNRSDEQVVNLSDLNRFKDGDSVTIVELKARGLIRKSVNSVKLLGSGELTKKLKVKVNSFSKKAKEVVEKIGGTVEEMKS